MKKLTTEEFIEKARKIHGDKYDYSKVIYTGAFSKVIIKCKIHGNFQQTANNHLLGSGCHICGFQKISDGNLKYSTEDFIKRAKITHEEKYDYSKSIYKNFDSKICIICKKHGDFFQRPSHHIYGRGCPKCAGRNKTTKLFIEEANEVHNERYNYNNVIYKDSKTKIQIECKQHGIFEQKPVDHLMGQGCPKCIGYISKEETKWLNTLNIPNTPKTRQVYIHGHKVDGYDPATKTIYEFLGDYWHGNPEKFNHDDINYKSNKTFGELYYKTFKKLKILKQKGYKIYYMWEKDWELWNKKIIKTFPIKIY